MRTLIFALPVLLFACLLASCGTGGSNNDDWPLNPAEASILNQDLATFAATVKNYTADVRILSGEFSGDVYSLRVILPDQFDFASKDGTTHEIRAYGNTFVWNQQASQWEEVSFKPAALADPASAYHGEETMKAEGEQQEGGRVCSLIAVKLDKRQWPALEADYCFAPDGTLVSLKLTEARVKNVSSGDVFLYEYLSFNQPGFEIMPPPQYRVSTPEPHS